MIEDHEPTPASETYRNGRLSRAIRLAMKELRETLRDRRTIFTLVLMPLLVYPLLAVALQRFALTRFRGNPEKQTFFVGVKPSTQLDAMNELVGLGSEVLHRQSAKSGVGPTSETAADEKSGTEIRFFGHEDLPDAGDLSSGLEAGVIDLGIEIEELEPGSQRRFPPRRYRIFHNPGSPRSQDAKRFFDNRLQAANLAMLRTRLRRRGANDQPPAELSFIATDSTSTQIVSLGALIPLILLLMTVTGAVYPAIDLTAGERERGTMEMLIAAPVPRIRLLIAKYAAVMIVALLTATVNLVAMTTTIYSIGLEKLLVADGVLSPKTIGLVFALTVLFAAFFSAVLLAVTSFARSFKEAQAYLIPLMLVSLAPGMLALMPGVKMNSLLAVAPLVNIVLLARDLFEGNAVALYATMTVASTFGYAALALAFAGRIFGTDAILYGSQGTWSDMLKPPEEQRQVPQMRTAMFCLAMMFPLFILLGNLPGRLESLSISVRLGLSSVVSVLLFVGVPLVLAKIRNIRIQTGFRLVKAQPLAFAGAALMGISLWTFAFNIVSYITQIDDERFAQFAGLIEQVNQAPLWLKLAVLAVVPAIAEEFFFRGFLLTGLRSALSPWRAILLSAVLFGLFHVIVRDRLLFERLISSTMMGVALGWVCLRTGSILPGMLLHVLNNGFFMLLAEYQTELADLGIGNQQQSMLPWHYLVIAAIVAGTGILLVNVSSRPVTDSDIITTAAASPVQ
jgi:sodium transport system permease protein